MNQGHEIRSFALNKEAKKGQGLKGLAAHLYPNCRWMGGGGGGGGGPPPPPPQGWSKSKYFSNRA